MPEQDGNTLPSEQTHFNLQGLKIRSLKADELLDLGLKGLNRSSKLPFALEAHIFITANKNYQQAVECFRYGLYEPSMVMVRATIDAVLYHSKYNITDMINNFDRDMGGSISSHIKWTNGGGKWEKLVEEARVLGLNHKVIRQIERLRDNSGNFSAHNAERQMYENYKYATLSESERRAVKKPKLFIDERTAYYVLKATGKFLVKVRKLYVSRAISSLRASAQF